MNNRRYHLNGFVPGPANYPGENTRNGIAALLLFCIIFTIYSGVYNCSWHFDDYRNITGNSRLHMDTISIQSIKNAMFAHQNNDRLYRPLPMLSFALNWYIGKDHVFGYHLVNNLIHFFNAFILFLTIVQILKTPTGKKRKIKNSNFIALFAALLWAVNPLQTQAVTYIVQRMASMAALFYLLSLFFYLKLRNSNAPDLRAIFTGCFILSLVASILSKENSLMLPFSILLLEYILFNDLKELFLKNIIKKKILIFSVLGLMFFLVLSGPTIFQTIEQSYQNRPFTLIERLLTQPRILVFYLSLIFYPVPGRLSIGHVITTSESFFDPITTLSSFLFIGTLIGVAIYNINRKPFFSLAVLFFFQNHVIESSFLGLELIYEHRNYLPSFFLFLPISIVVYNFLDSCFRKNTIIYYLSISFLILGISSLGMATYERNSAWETEKSLWENVLKNYPNSTRALHNLADQHYSKIGDYRTALKIYSKALSLDWHDNSSVFRKGITLNNVAAIYYGFGMDRKALQYWNSAIEVFPSNSKAILGKAQALTSLGEYGNALQTLSHIPEDQKSDRVFNLEAIIFYKLGDYSNSIVSCRESLHRAPFNLDSLVCLSSIFTKMGLYKKSSFFLKMALMRNMNNIKLMLSILENSIAVNDFNATEKHMNTLFSSYQMDAIYNALKFSKRNESLPLSLDKIIPIICENNMKITSEWRKSLENLIEY